MITPNGRYLGRKRPTPDARDLRFLSVHPEAANTPLPPKMDLLHKLPPNYDQSTLGSCGPNAGSALMAFFFPTIPVFSRLQIYYDVRVIEDDVDLDNGVETRDVLKTLTINGAAPETEWPYDIALFTDTPPVTAMADRAKHKLTTYSRLTTENEFLRCLASGFPFLVGFECYQSFDSDLVAKTGVLPWPQKGESVIGGHDVLAIGYDLNFKASEAFKVSGIDPSRVSNEALLIRNSWGPDWGWGKGQFWMPLQYASNPSLGGDNWTGRRTPPNQLLGTSRAPLVDGIPIEGVFV